MPCYDGRDREDQLRNERKLDALTALFCAYLKSPRAPDIQKLVNEWSILHGRVDRARRRKDFKDEIQTQIHYNEFMVEVWTRLCMQPEPAEPSLPKDDIRPGQKRYQKVICAVCDNGYKECVGICDD